MNLPRGFKAQANRISVGLRKQLGLNAHDPINLEEVAARRQIQIKPLSVLKVPEISTLLRHDKQISAILVKMDYGKKFIFYNPHHHINRVNSSIAHEIAHDLLGHPAVPLFSKTGTRNYDRQIEEEAGWLGPTLLISDRAALHILREQMSMKVATDLYGVSEQLMRMRLGASGATKRVPNAFNGGHVSQSLPSDDSVTDLTTRIVSGKFGSGKLT